MVRVPLFLSVVACSSRSPTWPSFYLLMGTGWNRIFFFLFWDEFTFRWAFLLANNHSAKINQEESIKKTEENCVLCASLWDCSLKPLARVLYLFLIKDLGRWLSSMLPGSTGRFSSITTLPTDIRQDNRHRGWFNTIWLHGQTHHCKEENNVCTCMNGIDDQSITGRSVNILDICCTLVLVNCIFMRFTGRWLIWVPWGSARRTI